MGYLAPQAFSRVLSETLSDEPLSVESWRRIPVLGKYIVGKSSDMESRRSQRTTVISGPFNPRHHHTEASTPGDNFQVTDALIPAGQTEVHYGAINSVPLRRERQIRFPDEGQISHSC